MNSSCKSPALFRFLMILGVALGGIFAFTLGSVVVGLPLGLCLSFFSGIIYCRSMEMFSTASLNK